MCVCMYVFCVVQLCFLESKGNRLELVPQLPLTHCDHTSDGVAAKSEEQGDLVSVEVLCPNLTKVNIFYLPPVVCLFFSGLLLKWFLPSL